MSGPWFANRGALAGCLLLVCGAGCAPAPPVAEPSPPAAGAATRVLVFNIHAGKDTAGKSNLDAVADLIRSTNADIALLQEVDRRTKRSGDVDQLDVLSKATGHRAVFGRSLDYQGGQYGIATLARSGFVANFTEPLPVRPAQARSGASYEPRAALVVVARSAAGNLSALNTHLDASRDEGYRLQEVETVLKLVAGNRRSGLPAMAGGDFNAEPGSQVHKRVLNSGLRDSWDECGKGEGLTYPSDKPVKRIDYLFLADPLHCTDARVIQTTISDHRPLLVTVRRGGNRSGRRDDLDPVARGARAPWRAVRP